MMWIICIIATTVIHNALAVPLGTCKELLVETQNLGDSEQCDLYYGCTPSGAVVKKLCEDGYVFHLHAARCVINVNVDCGNRTKLQDPVAPTKECPRLNGFFPHPDSGICNKFYQCVKGKGDLKTCPATLVFDLQFGICLYPDQVNRTGCTANDLIGAKCPKYDGKTPLQFGDHERFAAPGGDCRNFIICLEDGGIRKGSCPYGKVYNSKISSCDEPKNVPRCSTYYPSTTTPKPKEDLPSPFSFKHRKRPSTTQSFVERYKQRQQQRKQQQQQRQQQQQQDEQQQEEKQKEITRERPFRKPQSGGGNRRHGTFQGFRRGPQFRPEAEVTEDADATVDNNVPETRSRPQFRRRPQGGSTSNSQLGQARRRPQFGREPERSTPNRNNVQQSRRRPQFGRQPPVQGETQEESTTEKPSPATSRPSPFRRRTGIRDRLFKRPGVSNRKRPVITSRTQPQTESTTAAQPATPRPTVRSQIGREETNRARQRLRSLFARPRKRRPIKLKTTTPEVEIFDDYESVTTEFPVPQ